eukprot:9457916-Alexandrium_andersonii.AAC.1
MTLWHAAAGLADEGSVVARPSAGMAVGSIGWTVDSTGLHATWPGQRRALTSRQPPRDAS